MLDTDVSNLLQETIEVLQKNGKSEAEVLWVGTKEYWFLWEEFKMVANFNYDNGYGIEEINVDLQVVGKDWLLVREFYDGSEWWDFKSLNFPDKKIIPELRNIKC
jgi:hypothetical protein